MSKTQAPDPAQADLDAWRCDRCNGDGWHYVEREGVDPRDIVRTKEHCEECDGIGWCGPDARIAAGLLPHSVAEVVFFDPASRGPLPEKSGLIIDASLAFFRSAKIGDKLYSQAQMRAALSRCAIPAPEGAQLPPLPHPLLIAGGGQSWFNAEQMRAYARAALAAPAPQDSLDSAQPSNQVAMQAAPVALTNEQIAYSCCEIMLSEHPIDYDIAIGRAVIAEFCRVNGIPAPQTKEPKA